MQRWAKIIGWSLLTALILGLLLASIDSIRRRTMVSDRLLPEPLQIRAIDRQADFYRQQIAVARQNPVTEKVAGVQAVIVPHHLLATSMITEALGKISQPEKIKRIVVVSPDHFQRVPTGKLGQATGRNWSTPFGELKGWQITDGENELQQSFPNLEFGQEQNWQVEHGIYGLIPLVKNYFPQAQVLPIILGSQPASQRQSLLELGKQLRDYLTAQNIQPAEMLLIVSSDFVHQSDQLTAKEIDQRNLTWLADLNPQTADQIDNDCAECWWLVLGWQAASPAQFEFLANHDATDFGAPNQNVTSYITGYFVNQNPKNSSPAMTTDRITTITLAAGGDVMLGRTVNARQIQHQDWRWAGRAIESIFQAAELSLINLESPLVENCPTTNEGMIFCAPPAAAAGLRAMGINVANLANNHSLNYGQSELQTTVKTLTQAQISVVGANGDGQGELVVKEIAGVKIGFLGFDDVSQRLINEEVATQISSSSGQVDTLVTTWHWGNEYQAQPTTRQIELAHLAIENGADLVIGHHPHWVQTKETYLGRQIYYSLGNLIFDQMWSEKTRQGLLVEFELTARPRIYEAGYETQWRVINEIPTYIEDYGRVTISE